MILLSIFFFLRSTNIVSIDCAEKMHSIRLDSKTIVRYRSFTSEQNSLLDNQERVIKKTTVHSMTECLKSCIADEICQSYNIGPPTSANVMNCSLLNTSVYEHRSMIKHSPGWTHSSLVNKDCERGFCRNNQPCVSIERDGPVRCVCTPPYAGRVCEFKGPLCPASHAYAFQHGRQCCAHNKDCYHKPIHRESTCCLDNACEPCPSDKCEKHPYPGSVQLECPSTHPFVYFNGKHCCMYNKDLYLSQLTRESENCLQHLHTYCYDENRVQQTTCKSYLSPGYILYSRYLLTHG